jgi:hypothetical protein
MTDLAVFKQGEIYCAAARKDFLTTISAMSSNFDLQTLKQTLFSYLDRSTKG